METRYSRRSSDRGDRAPSLTALIVGDETSSRERVAALARSAGFTTDETSHAAAAGEAMSNATYDLVVVDMEVPGAGELELSDCYSIAVVFDLSRQVQALMQGFDDAVPKTSSDLEVVAALAGARRLLLRDRAFDRVVRELYGLAARDELTGVFNRRFFMAEAEKLLRKGPMGMVLFDLDGFKRVNDTFGHLTGDRVLRDIGALFQRSTRPDDLLARYGGDEFVFVVGGDDARELERIAERIARAVAALRWTIGSREFQVGVTMGIARSSVFPEPSLTQMLDLADRNLYDSKRGGNHDREIPLPPPQPESRV
ncbi:MAG TPA: GGDEF domain-containing response regulator [Thermoanaerobaculia bacterium]|nr:GGDEF domain-containing response regulator [Thermoanaerobaculia bacterium]